MNVILEFISAGIEISIFQPLLSPPVKALMDDLFLVSHSATDSGSAESCSHSFILVMNVCKTFQVRNMFVKRKI